MKNTKLQTTNENKTDRRSLIAERKLRISIFDLTDCEGCELQFLALREKLFAAGIDLEVTNWRLGTAAHNSGPFDATFIEGSPIAESDVEIIKQARRVSEKIITLGSCAALGGLQSALPESTRAKNLKDIYGPRYKTSSKAPKPVAYYIDVDTHLPGCPISLTELERLISSLSAGKKFTPKNSAVCLDCKIRGNACLFLDEGYCLGPVTRGGCEAPCPTAGLACKGCFGPLPNANLAAIEKAAKHMDKKEIDSSFRLFMRHSDEYRNYRTNPKNLNIESPRRKATLRQAQGGDKPREKK